MCAERAVAYFREHVRTTYKLLIISNFYLMIFQIIYRLLISGISFIVC